MEQNVRIWGEHSKFHLSSYLTHLIEDGYTIVSVTPTEWYAKPFITDHYMVVAAIIIVSKQIAKG